MKAWFVVGTVLGLCGACGGEDSGEPAEPGVDAGGSSSSSGGSGSNDGGSSGVVPPRTPGCHETPQADDATRFVVLAKPYGSPTNEDGSVPMVHKFEVYALESSGTVSKKSEFELNGYASFGRIAFTPDGRVGAVALDSRTDGERGTVGVFTLDDAGNVTVVETGYKGDFFSDAVTFSPDGGTLYVSNSGTPEIRGGIYAIPVACDGKLGATTRMTETRTTSVPAWLPSSAPPWRAVFVGAGLEGAKPDEAAHVVTIEGSTLVRLGSSNPFGGEQTLIDDIVFGANDEHVLFSAPTPGVGGQRLIAARLQDGAPVLEQEWPLEGHATVVASPYGNAFFVATADPDRAYTMTYDANASAGSAFGAPVRQTYGSLPLPGLASVITRGALRGRVVMAELSAIRQFQFQADGSVADVGPFDMESEGPDDVTAVIGGFGITL